MNWMRWKETSISAGQRLDRQGLGQPRHALEQHVPVGEQPDQQAVDQVLLADDDLGHPRQEIGDEAALLPDAGVELLDAGVHPSVPSRWLLGDQRTVMVKPSGGLAAAARGHSLPELLVLA